MQLIEEANLHLRRGELTPAANLCRQFLLSHPGNVPALQVLEAICAKWVQHGRYDQAVACFELMLQQCTNSADLHFNLAAALIRLGEQKRGIESLRAAARLRPDWIDAHYHLALALEEAGEFGLAASQWKRVLELNPDHGSALFRLGVAHSKLGDQTTAQDYIAKARRAPPNSLLCNDLGLRSLSQGLADQAIIDLKRATILDPRFAAAWMNLGIAQMRRGLAQESLTSFETSLFLEPGRPQAHWNYSAALLATGDYAKGWDEYEWRLRCPEFSAKTRITEHPPWQGDDLRDRTILLHDEQGYGDTFQFIRYAPLLAERGAKVIILCQKPMARILSRVPRIACVLTDGQPCPHIDVHIPIPSLPLRFNTRLETIPANVPYLAADRSQIERWTEKLPHRKNRLRVGLVWHGNSTPNPNRSIPVEMLNPLIEVEGVLFHSLQKQINGVCVRPPASMPIHDFSDQIGDFSDTAALIGNMDLIICIDTAAAHLSGAMGKPTWTLLPHSADWRWLLNRGDTPWYPTMRLFRQDSPGNWPRVIDYVARELKRHAAMAASRLAQPS